VKKNGKRVIYLKVSEKEAKYFLNLACHEEHFFIDESTPFSTYYIITLMMFLQNTMKSDYANIQLEDIGKSTFIC